MKTQNVIIIIYLTMLCALWFKYTVVDGEAADPDLPSSTDVAPTMFQYGTRLYMAPEICALFWVMRFYVEISESVML